MPAPANDSDFDTLDFDDAPKKAAPKTKAAAAGVVVAKAAPNRGAAKPKAKGKSPVAACDKPGRGVYSPFPASERLGAAAMAGVRPPPAAAAAPRPFSRQLLRFFH